MAIKLKKWEALQFLRQHEHTWDKCTCRQLALHGDITLTEQMIRAKLSLSNDYVEQYHSLLTTLARFGSVEELQLMRSLSSELFDADLATVGSIVAQTGQLDTLRYCVTYGYRLDENTFDLALVGNNLAMLQWLRQQGCPLHRKTKNSKLLRSADLAVVSWLLDTYPERVTKPLVASSSTSAETCYFLWQSHRGTLLRGPYNFNFVTLLAQLNWDITEEQRPFELEWIEVIETTEIYIFDWLIRNRIYPVDHDEYQRAINHAIIWGRFILIEHLLANFDGNFDYDWLYIARDNQNKKVIALVQQYHCNKRKRC